MHRLDGAVCVFPGFASKVFEDERCEFGLRYGVPFLHSSLLSCLKPQGFGATLQSVRNPNGDGLPSVSVLPEQSVAGLSEANPVDLKLTLSEGLDLPPLLRETNSGSPESVVPPVSDTGNAMPPTGNFLPLISDAQSGAVPAGAAREPLMQAMMLVALPLFLVVVFLGGIGTSGWALLGGIGKYVIVLVLVILIKNTNPRVRIDQAMRFFWFYCGTVLVAAVILATLGNYYGLTWL